MVSLSPECSLLPRLFLADVCLEMLLSHKVSTIFMLSAFTLSIPIVVHPQTPYYSSSQGHHIFKNTPRSDLDHYDSIQLLKRNSPDQEKLLSYQINGVP
jgi:hypothetical protein